MPTTPPPTPTDHVRFAKLVKEAPAASFSNRRNNVSQGVGAEDGQTGGLLRAGERKADQQW
jgi:hypothetical protein